MDLESKMTAMQEELSNAPVRKVTSSGDWIPRPPERWTLTGHRNPITRVAFHPVFTILASASEDTTIRIYDYETGEYERTLKGHTKAVQDLAFDPKGNFLGKLQNPFLVILLSQALCRSWSYVSFGVECSYSVMNLLHLIIQQ
jgi:platelet-activating factor acetylhydrolase IB subunit alpha